MRAVDPRRTRKALRRVRRLAASAEEASLSDWEKTFLGEVGARLEEYGSAFADYAKGAPDEALSRLQGAKLREISSKARKDGKIAKENRAGTQAHFQQKRVRGVATENAQIQTIRASNPTKSGSDFVDDAQGQAAQAEPADPRKAQGLHRRTPLRAKRPPRPGRGEGEDV